MKAKLLFICMLFSGTSFSGGKSISKKIDADIVESESPGASLNQTIKNEIHELFYSIEWGGNAMEFSIFEKAIKGFTALKNADKLSDNNLISIVDYNLPSTEKRLWVLDLDKQKVLFNTLVAHGKNTGENVSSTFSNQPESYQTSLGFFITGNTYIGKHGLSLYLDGMEEGINDNARERNIVIHGANYVNVKFISQHGRIGRSLGCPAVPVNLSSKIIKTIANKTCFFAYHPNESYVNSSALLNSSF